MSAELRHVARRQAGAFTRSQARRFGMSSAEVNRRVLDGDLLELPGGVLVVAGAPVTEQLQAWVAVLAVGQPVSLASATAGRRLGLERVPAPARPQLVVPNTRDPLRSEYFEVRRAVPSRWRIVWRHGLPVTPPATTIRDLAADLRLAEVRDIVQHALRRRQVTERQLLAELGRGLAGSARLRRVLEEIAPGYQVKWERILHRALAQRGVVLRPQTPVQAADGRRAFIDLGDEELRFGVEIEGFVNHMARFAADRRRARMLALELGWTIAPVAVEEIVADLPGVVAEIVRHVRGLRSAA
jgi:very-short-patch-repair endonuclease